MARNSLLQNITDYTVSNSKWASEWNIVTSQYNKLGGFMKPSIDVVRRVFNVCAHLTQKYDPTHDLGHHAQVFKNGMEICRRMMLNNRMRVITMVIYSTLTHDIIDWKYPENLAEKKVALTEFFNTDLANDAVNTDWIVNHMSYGKENKARIEKENLLGRKLIGTTERTDWISHVDPDVQLARDIASDADKLEAIGKIGVERTYGVARLIHAEKIKAMNKDDADAYVEKKVIEHAHEKLLLLKDDFIYTLAGKELAVPGHEYIAAHVTILEKRHNVSKY